MKYLLFIGLFAFSAVHAAPPESQFDSIVKFLKDHVQGTTIELAAEGPSYDEKYTLLFKRTITFGKLKVKDNSLFIDLTAKVERTSLPVAEAAGDEAAKEFSEKTDIVRRLELSERVSTGKVVGFMRTLTENGEKVYGDGDVVVGEFDAAKNTLLLTDSNVGYVDETLDGENYHAVSRSNDYAFQVVKKEGDEKEQLVLNQKTYTHLVDPATLKMELKSTHEFTSAQIPGLPRLFSK